MSFYETRLAPPIPRVVRAEEVAELALFLAGDELRTITEAEHLIDVGFTAVENIPAGPQ